DVLIEALLLDTENGATQIFATRLPAGVTAFPALTIRVPAAHWAERALGDFFGLHAEGHPRWKGLLLHEAWPADLTPLREVCNGSRVTGHESGSDLADSRPVTRDPRRYAFLEVGGEGVHEIPVGPIHAGIIEPGHFRFSCLGEVITNLEIRLGYQHRG